MQFHQTEVSMSMTEASGALQRKPSPASSTEDLSMSTDPLIIQDIKQIPSGIQSNKSERGKITANVGQQLDEIVIQDDKGTSQPVSPQRERTYSQTYDGVFSNLSAKPEIMVLPAENARYVDDPPPYVDTRMAAATSRFMTMDAGDVADTVDEIFLDEYEVGSILAFIVCTAVVIVFQVWGFLIAFILSQSHASRLGTIAGLGLLIAFSSISMQSDLERAVGPALQPWVPLICLVAGIFGYMLFIFSMTSYQRIRRVAQSMIGVQAPRATATFSV